MNVFVRVLYIPFCICLCICPGIYDHDLSLFYAFHLLLLLFEPPAEKNELGSWKKKKTKQSGSPNIDDGTQIVPPLLWLFSLSLLPQNLPFQSEIAKNQGSS